VTDVVTLLKMSVLVYMPSGSAAARLLSDTLTTALVPAPSIPPDGVIVTQFCAAVTVQARLSVPTFDTVYVAF